MPTLKQDLEEQRASAAEAPPPEAKPAPEEATEEAPPAFELKIEAHGTVTNPEPAPEEPDEGLEP